MGDVGCGFEVSECTGTTGVDVTFDNLGTIEGLLFFEEEDI